MAAITNITNLVAKTTGLLSYCSEGQKSEISFIRLKSSCGQTAAAKSRQSCPTVRPHRRQPNRLPHPWDSPGKNTGLGCQFLLQAWKWKVKVMSLNPTLRDPMDCSLPGSSVHGIFQARILEWVASGQTSIPLKATYISILTHGPFIIKASRVGLSISDKRFNYLLFLINSRHFANMMKLLLLIILSLVKSVAYKNVDLLKYFLFRPPPCKNTV